MESKQRIGVSCRAESNLVQKLSKHTDSLYDAIDSMRHLLKAVPQGAQKAADYYHDVIIPAMNTLRSEADILETLTDKSYWPYPTYSDLLFNKKPGNVGDGSPVPNRI